jgi:hypothetical protein
VSSHKCLYLGPYVECLYQPATREDFVWGCTVPECSKHPTKIQPAAAGKFCATCGASNGKVPITVPAYPDHSEITGEQLHEIHSEDYYRKVLWLVPNVRRQGDPRPDWDDDVEIHLDLQHADPEWEMKWFKRAFAKELEALEEHYATITVKWGLHQYWM